MYATADILQAAVTQNASDIHIAAGRVPTLRVNGRLAPLGDAVMSPDDTLRFVRDIAPPKHLENLNARGGSDFSHVFQNDYQFRVSIFKQRGLASAVLRLIPSTTRALAEIGLGERVRELLDKPRGLVLLTGPTGSGKSTTLAAMVDCINCERDCNIITIEDPIEYRHKHKKSIVVQREVGEDVPTFEEALVRALRQDPDVILVGEMRNLETIEAAIRAAETGHLVFSTLHTTGAARTVDRIVDVFPANHRDEIRTQLAGTLLAVISQQLLPRVGGGRVAAFEIMFNTTSIAAYIRENKTYRITSDLQTGAKFGMCTMDSSLVALYTQNQISYQDMIAGCYDRDSLQKLLDNYAATHPKRR
jgi:twitching motility protein PilT